MTLNETQLPLDSSNMEFNMNLSEMDAKRAESFFEIYEIEHIIKDEERPVFLGEKMDRKCRFCNKQSPEVTFKKDAHVIPQLMGNAHLLSYFECDTCNSLFSKYEDSFANFTGIHRTVYAFLAKKKVPKFKNPQTGFLLTTQDNKLFTKVNGDLGDEIIIDDENKTGIINTVRHTYVPMYIPKVLLKIAFCMLREHELKDYELLRLFLSGSDYDEKFDGNTYLKVFSYVFPGPPIVKPKALLYRKKQAHHLTLAPQKHLIVHFSNFVFQICLPYNEKDKDMIGKTGSFHIYPLLIDKEFIEQKGDASESYTDFSSSKKRIGEKHSMKFSFGERIRNVNIEN